MTFQRPVILSTGDSAFAGANCGAAYHGPSMGLWVVSAPGLLLRPRRPGDESALDAAERHQGLAYAAQHLGRVPAVVVVRVSRVWQVYAPLQDADVAADDGRPKWRYSFGLAAYAALVPLGIAGGLRLRRRGVPLTPLTAQVALVSLTAALVWGGIRFRAPAEVVLVVLAGVALGPRPGR